jgi:glycosyltransferase involved in cell wall biosynthesis
VELTILMPCLDEAETLATCIGKAQAFIRSRSLEGEVVIADNGSTDGSQDITRALGARVVDISTPGYGAALQGGIAAAAGRFVIMGDADDSYDFSSLDPFVAALRDGADLVMGNRFAGGVAPGAMPPLHRYLGNPVLSFIGRLLFRSECRDFHCGLRGFRRDAIIGLDLRATGMEFASEMVVRSTLAGLKIVEVPTTLVPDGRSRPPHLRSWRDGWRHLRFLLLYSPRWLFLLPGTVLAAVGVLTAARLSLGPVWIGDVGFEVNTLVAACGAIVIGYQAVLFAIFTKVFAVTEGFHPPDQRFDRLFRVFKLEVGLLAGAIVAVAGFVGLVVAVLRWDDVGFASLDPATSLRLVVPASTAVVVGFQTILGSLFLSILGLGRRTTAVLHRVRSEQEPGSADG